MWRVTMIGLMTLAATTGGWAQEGTVYLRGADGTWALIDANAEGGAIHFTLTPDQVPDGRATLVINKPDWMVLNDDAAPAVTGFTVDGETFELAAGDAIDLGERSEAPGELTLAVADDKNPIDAKSITVTASGGALPVTVDASALGETDTSGNITLSLADVEPGIYEATLRLADMSPQRNTAEVPLRLSVFGASVGPGGQSVRLAGGGVSYELLPEGQKFINVGAGGPSLYLTTQMHGRFLYVNGFAEAEELDEDDTAGVRIVCDLRDIDGNAVTNDEAESEIVYEARLNPELGCLMVTSHAKNLGDAADIYCFWGWVPGDGYVTPDGETHEWTMKYEHIGEVGWVFLPSKTPGKPGLGWISPGMFGQSRFGTMVLYTNPTRVKTDPDGEVTTHLAVFPAESAEEVAEVARQLNNMGWPE